MHAHRNPPTHETNRCGAHAKAFADIIGKASAVPEKKPESNASDAIVALLPIVDGTLGPLPSGTSAEHGADATFTEFRDVVKRVLIERATGELCASLSS